MHKVGISVDADFPPVCEKGERVRSSKELDNGFQKEVQGDLSERLL